MAKKYSLTIVHLFPRLMNIYGDKGNIITLMRRCQWRGIDVKVLDVNEAKDFDLIKKGDLFFFGGGQDKDQITVSEIIGTGNSPFRQLMSAAVEANKVFLLVCGGYQLFGHHFVDGQGNEIPGLGLLDVETKSTGPETKERCIGNCIVQTDLPMKPSTLIGFENHGGQTVLGASAKIHPLGKVVTGYGNNLTSGEEGCRYKNVFGTYLHGSLLPKNPQFADYLIRLVLETKYGKTLELSALEDSLEIEVHQGLVKRMTKK